MDANKVVALAQSWVGKNERNGSHRMIIDIYNTQRPLPRGYAVKYTDSWCATFISALAVQLNCTDIIPTECSCPYMIGKFQQMGCWDENDARTPNPGDIIFYDWEDSGSGDNHGSSDHVGIVEQVYGGNMVIIEGNYHDSVARRNIRVNGRYIRGYGVPKYSGSVIPTPTEYTLKQFITDVQITTGANVDGIAGPNTLAHTVTVSASTNRTHAVVVPLQKRLKQLGFYHDLIDGHAGPNFTKAVKDYQKIHTGVVDGIITAQHSTWKCLLEMEDQYSQKDFVTEVQKAIGANVDGYAGPNTLSHTVTVSKSVNRTHAVVKPLQKKLKQLGYYTGEIDGHAGPLFDNAAKKYQKSINNKYIDGEFTAKQTTWKKILGM